VSVIRVIGRLIQALCVAHVARGLLAACWACAAMLWAQPALAEPPEGDITLQARYWIDPTGQADIRQAAADPARLQPFDRYQSIPLGTGALWMRFDLPTLDARQRWYLLLTGAAFLNRATLYTPAPDGSWSEQRAGDHVPVAQWSLPHFAPLFAVTATEPQAVWLRLENHPAPASPFVLLLTESRLQDKSRWTLILVGGYIGFGLLVFVVGLMHARLYGDRAFHAYCAYVACMLLFQLSYTGMGGLLLWPQWAWFNDAAPALFMLNMAGSGIWFIREATALPRHSRLADRAVVGFSLFGPLFALAYVTLNNSVTYAVLNVYGLLSVLLSITLCLWTWRRGETYSGWLFVGFLPIHLTYPFPALRAAGVLPDSWLTQYAVLIGSALEIPLLLYILHMRAKDFSENRVRLRALDSTDPLTGLTIAPVLRLRVRDALRRARRSGHRCTVMLVELANHEEIVADEGREAGDRALVVAASRLSGVVREVDTVCRIEDNRFALLLEGPQPDDARRQLAQLIVARGLEPLPPLPPHLNLRFRVVSAWVPDGTMALAEDGTADEQRLLLRLQLALDRLLESGRRVVHHLEARPDEADAGTPSNPPGPESEGNSGTD